MSTLVVAHRTCQRDARENSLDGISTGARLGADVVEVDARRSRDGTVVLLHDPLLLRVQHRPLPVKWLRDAQLVRLGVPTLADALEVAGEVGVRLAIDTKDAGAAGAVLETVRSVGATDRVLLWSQHMPTVRSYVRALPDAQVALLRDTFDPAAHDRFLADAAAIGARAVSAHQDAVTPAFLAATITVSRCFVGTRTSSSSRPAWPAWPPPASKGSSPIGPVMHVDGWRPRGNLRACARSV